MLPIRVINPTKSDLGKISKKILDRILRTLRNKLPSLNQFRSTDDALKWFNNHQKHANGLITFDIENFYPSITERILKNAAEKEIKFDLRQRTELFFKAVRDKKIDFVERNLPFLEIC